MVDLAGKKAVKTGNNLEDFIERILKNYEYQPIEREKFDSACYLEQPIYTRQYHIGKSIYGSELACDYILYHPVKHPYKLVIESKWQQSGGSVDEKFPYLVINIKEKFPFKTIIILDGNGYKKGAEKWLRNQKDDRLIYIFNMSEFQIWVNNGNI